MTYGLGNWDTEVTMTSQPLVFSAPRRGMPPRHLADLSLKERTEAVTAIGEKPMRARQLSHHYFGRLSVDAPGMTDIPASARDGLARELLPPLLTPVRQVSCDDGATSKTLWRAHDGTLLESVVMRYPDRATVCVSSQAGCGMACPFCATGQGGLTRNLSTAEIADQVRAAASTSATFHLVFTGTSSSRSSSSGACRDTASVTEKPSSASLRIAWVSPTVETVTPRCEMPKPPGTGSQIRRTASTVRW